MTQTIPAPILPLWAGRTMALLGILLVAADLRTVVASLSPIADAVGADIPLGAIGLAVIGMAPPIAFSLSGLFGSAGARRLGLERFLMVAVVAIIVGLALRAVAGEYVVLLVGTTLALAGAGVGNILLPPLVKRYFPDRVGLMTSLYATTLSLGTAAPAAFAVPVADLAGWRSSLAVWSVVAAVSMIPWVVVLVQQRSERLAIQDSAVPELEEPAPELVSRIWRSRTAWAITLLFGMSSFQAYALFAWLPMLLVDTAGVGAFDAGALLSLFSFIGVPAAFFVPIIAVRLRNVGWIVQLGVAGYVLGYLGLLFAPSLAPFLWILLLGGGQVVFPTGLVLVNLRTRTHDGAVALSGFAQGVGYAVAAFGPLLVGVVHDLTGGWTGALIVLLLGGIALIPLGILLRERRFVEDELPPA